MAALIGVLRTVVPRLGRGADRDRETSSAATDKRTDGVADIFVNTVAATRRSAGLTGNKRFIKLGECEAALLYKTDALINYARIG